jgi:hypothetical protein
MIPLTAILDVGSKLIDKLIPDPEAKARAQVQLLEMQQRGELAQIASRQQRARQTLLNEQRQIWPLILG